MASAQNFGRSVLIILFAAGVVALGAQELKKRYASGRIGIGGNRKQAEEMVKSMHGSDLKARMSDREVAEHAREPAANREALKDSPKVSEKETDSLSGGDRRELKDLLNRMVP